MIQIAKTLLNFFKYSASATIVVWCIGLVLFINAIPSSKDWVDDIKTDAIVVLTGGSMRLEAGLELFSKMLADKVLISGVGKNVTKPQVMKIFTNNKNVIVINEQNIVLGDMADSTFSNAVEAKIFMDLNKYESLRLVTSTYHMPRSKMIFKAYLPGYAIIEHPVGFEKSEIIEKGKYKLIFNEYNKFIGSGVLILWDKYTKFIDAIFSD